ncbi:hypothetical protein GCM10011575_41620 [Microlunatus endophyticus]|uniref:Uncharacterized protein n=1 Tax=Microlunatus endophyticus TaxID=1716077 RepID=A0A917W900_9ACTN|nr:hypothetical protein [Microlunatus endophyticus]GGL78927.1 hypothetical protein GCM10011575_41620 [Microlunatus endophyticus]
MRHFDGVVQLPSAAFVAEDVLGETFIGQSGGATFELTFPVDPKPNAGMGHSLDQPRPVDGIVRDAIESRLWGWGYASHTKQMPDGQEGCAVAWMVEQIAVNITFDDADNAVAFFDLADRFREAFDAWYRIAVDWTELWSGAILQRGDSRVRTSRGQVRDADAPSPGSLSGWGGSLILGASTFFRSESALNRKMLASAFARADAEEEPPLEWGLFLRSQREPDRRIAVIDAATATEVALTGALDVRLRGIGSSAREVIAKNANGLVGLITLLESIDDRARNESLVKRVADQLAGPRNDAAHRGAIPANARRAFSTAKAVLDQYSPLGQP